MAASSSSALDALMLPFAQGLLEWPRGPVLFLRARDGAALRRFPLEQLVCEQGFRPEADALERAGLHVVADVASLQDTSQFPLVLVLPSRQRDEARALLARAVQWAAPGGRVVAAMDNNEGARSGEADLKALAGSVSALTKFHCRTFWTPSLKAADEYPLLQTWAALDAPRAIEGGRYLSRPGVFAWNRIDPASALLAEHLPADLSGAGADLGAGWGYLSVSALSRCPGIHALDLYEAESRALALARDNLAACAPSARCDFFWHDVTHGLPKQYDFIISNPPFHAQGRADRPDIGQRFIAAAAAALKPRGRLWLVANRHLPYESELRTHFASVRTVAERDGFKVIEAVRAA
ncbi:methyltransferase [Aerolutibacter daejeonensis]|uniref:class I SAM-dependent methyltransferase n=1 Tax=Aerolutibacter daejeonensis TaxID=346181 RepID=UPI000566C2E5